MGKTYRRDPETGLYPDRKRKKRYADEQPDTAAECCQSPIDNDDPYGPIDPDWAIGRMRKCVENMVGNLVKDGTIMSWQEGEYEQLIYIRIWRVSSTYDPTITNEEGKRSTKVHFLERVVCSSIQNIRRDISLAKRRFKTVPVGDLFAVDEDGGDDEESDTKIYNEFISDNCRWERDKDLFMDFPIIKARCSTDELTCLLMRLDKARDQEIVDEINLMRDRAAGFDAPVKYIDRFAIKRYLLPALQKISRDCGYCPEGHRRRDVRA